LRVAVVGCRLRGTAVMGASLGREERPLPDDRPEPASVFRVLNENAIAATWQGMRWRAIISTLSALRAERN